MSDQPEPQPQVRAAGASATTRRSGPEPGAAGNQGTAPAEDSALPPLTALLEAVLLVADEPVPAAVLGHVLECPADEVEMALRRLSEQYEHEERGFELRAVAGGWRLYTRHSCAPWVERFLVDGQQARLTQAALETLAIIAYRQPITRARIGAVRGVNPDGVVRTLLARGLVAEVGADAESGGTLLGTTPLLLEKLGLRSLDELPALSPLLPEIHDLEQAHRPDEVER